MLISTGAQKILKVCHLLGVSCWFGGCIALATLVYASSSARESFELYGILNGARYVNVVVVVYLGGFATFFTGLAYSVCTNRGFFRYPWVTAKWLMTVCAVGGGAFLVGPRSTRMLEAADAMGIAALRTPGYVEMHTFVLILLGIVLGLQTAAVILSVYRPGENRGGFSLSGRKGQTLPPPARTGDGREPEIRRAQGKSRRKK